MFFKNSLKTATSAVLAFALLPIAGLFPTLAAADPPELAQPIRSQQIKQPVLPTGPDGEVYETLPVLAGLSKYFETMNVSSAASGAYSFTAEQFALIYDKDAYLALNPDVAEAYGANDSKVLDHFLTKGINEGRVASTTFDVNSYFLQYPDLRQQFGLDYPRYYHHYVNIGIGEGRNPVGYSDPSAVGEAAIRGRSSASVEQMAASFRASGHAFPMATYARYGASSIEEFCTILFEEATAEGVRAEVVFAQCMHETGWLQFYGDVSGSQCNFAGLGVYGGSQGVVFNDWGTDSVRKGLRAQIQHLMAYCSTDKLANDCVDPRFSLITRGCAPTVYDLGGKWAVPGTNYGNAIMSIVADVLAR